MLRQWKYFFSSQLALAFFAGGEVYSQEDETFYNSHEEMFDQITNGESKSDFELSIDNCSVTACQMPVETSVSKQIIPYSIVGEMLYLKPYLQGMISTFGRDSPLEVSTLREITDRLHGFDLDFDFGFRIGTGFRANWMNLETDLTWMHFHSHSSQDLPIGNPFIGFNYNGYWNNSFSEPFGGGYVLSHRVKLHFDQIDLASKIPLVPTKWFTIAPKLGIRGILTDINVKFKEFKTDWGLQQLIIITPPFNTVLMTQKEKYRAIGLLTGLDTATNFGKGFYLDTIFNAALVFGDLHTAHRSKTIVPIQTPDSLPTIYDSKTSDYLFRPVIDAQFLLSWKKEWRSPKVSIDIHAGYEVHYLPNFLQMVRLNDSGSEVNEYDFSMQGVIAGITFSF